MAMSAEHRSKFTAQWWRLHMSETFSSEPTISQQTNKTKCYQFLIPLLKQRCKAVISKTTAYVSVVLDQKIDIIIFEKL